MNAAQASALHRLETLRQLAAEKEDRASRELATALARHANAQDRHAELLRYEQEYAERGSSTEVALSSTRVQALQHRAGFLTKLREAVQFQTERAASLGAEVERARARWVSLHREVDKLDQLRETTRQQIAAVEARRDAKEQDEFAQQGWLRQRLTA
jgi:flagellar FliJ protein